MNILLEPINDRVLIKAIAAETITASGLYIPDSHQEKHQYGTVIGKGPNVKQIEIKDRVLFRKITAIEVADFDDTYLMQENDVLAIVHKTEK